MVAVRPKQRNEIYGTRPVTDDEKELVLETILRLESTVYEPARRDTRETLSIGLNDPYGVAIVAEESQDGCPRRLRIGRPLEAFRRLKVQTKINIWVRTTPLIPWPSRSTPTIKASLRR